MCPSCIVNNFFKHLLRNRWANLDKTWQECSLRGPLQKMFTEFDSIKNSGCHGNEIEFFKQFFKNLLLWNRWSDFEIISQKCSLCDPFQNLFAKFWSIHKHSSCEWGLLALYGHKEVLKKNLLRNCWSDFEIISQECSLGDPFQILFAKFWSVPKHGSCEWGLFELYRHKEILKRSCSQKPLVRFWNNFTGIRVWH